MSGPWLGVIADDVTGACDLADAACAEGAATVVQWGPGAAGELPPCDVAVVALKSRTAPVIDAVAESQAAAVRLQAAGCTWLYQKYCSTFDSTDSGNIGPVADALRRIAAAGAVSVGAVSVGTPATPRAGRTVYQGHLFVGRQLLSESPMRDHPLTPMRDSDLVAVLGRQTRASVGLVDHAVVRAGAGAVRAAVSRARAAGAGHLIADALDDADLDTVAAALLGDDGPVVIGGGAGLAAALVRTRAGGRPTAGARAVRDVPPGARLILCGSCSARSREQVAAFPGPVIPLSPLDLAADRDATVTGVVAEIARAFGAGPLPVLVSSAAAPEQVRAFDATLGPGRAAALLEAAAGEIARRAVADVGVRRLLVAGGETSGAVIAALGITTMQVGPAAAPGVPWMVPAEGPPIALLLKSGNFGPPELFTTAWDVAP